MENTKKKENAPLNSVELLDKIRQLCNENGWKLFEYSFDCDKDYGCKFLTVKLL
ncbi:MAG: hypothetical protein ACTTKB_08255 [Treponema sp.]